MKRIIITVGIFLTLLLGGCQGIDLAELSDDDLDRLADKAIVCGDAYMRHGTGCCLDLDKNEICDEDEKVEVKADPILAPIPEPPEANPLPNPEPQPVVPNPKPVVEKTDLIMEGSVKGDANAPVTIIEFSDFECPFCKRFVSQTLPQIEEKYIKTGKVKFVYKNFPLGFYQNSQKAAEAAACSKDQGKFWEMHDMLFNKGVKVGIDGFKQYAVDLGLDATKFNTCLDTDAKASEVQTDLAEGSAAGIRGTPGFLINGKKLSGAQPFEVFQQMIEAELT